MIFLAVQTFKSEDPEGAGVHWDVTGLDADDFEISEYGVLRFKGAARLREPDEQIARCFRFQ